MKKQNQKSKEASRTGGNNGITRKVKERVLKAYDKEFGRYTNNVKRDSR